MHNANTTEYMDTRQVIVSMKIRERLRSQLTTKTFGLQDLEVF
jgi:hypothetical protein